jgi:hypothetical protein
LPLESVAEAILANDELVELETYGCSINWFGKVYDTQVVTNDYEYGLIGTSLFVDQIITVDYKAKSVRIDLAIVPVSRTGRCQPFVTSFLACASGWPRLFHSMRASGQTELQREFPQHVVSVLG